jgi:hypothetical protein
MTFHTPDFRAAAFCFTSSGNLPASLPYDSLAPSDFSRFVLEQCRRFSAARDGLGAFPIDAVSEALNQIAPEGSAHSAFGLLHEIVRILSVEGRPFRWYPDCCRMASPDEKRLMEACSQACCFELAGLDRSLSLLVDASLHDRLTAALRELVAVMGAQVPPFRR